MKIPVGITHNLLKSFTAKDFKSFIRNSGNPSEIQENYLLRIISKNANTAFGRKYHFNGINSISDFQKFVPLMEYEDYQDYISQIASSKPAVLTAETVLKLVPTSGTTGYNKFIPYTKSTISEFNLALNVWMYSLYCEFPELKKGRAFWLISPAGKVPDMESRIPVGFENDNSYFGSPGSRLISSIMALPDTILQITNPDHHWHLLSVYLLRATDLSMISAWNPTFIINLLAYIADNKSLLVENIKTGRITLSGSENIDSASDFKISPDKKLAERLNYLVVDGDIDQTRWCEIWPKLQLISCWTDAWAAAHIPGLQSLFKNVFIQGKGLLATEGAVTIPVLGKHLPAYYSHFFEFLDVENGEIKLIDKLEINKQYEVIITTGSGLYRYQLHDLVRVRSFYNQLPELEFLGKNNVVSDLVGEKLSEQVVSRVLSKIKSDFAIRSEIMFLSPCISGKDSFYTLYLTEKPVIENLIESVDKALSEVFYYDHARKFRQLEKPGIFILSKKGEEMYLSGKTYEGQAAAVKFLSLDKRLNLFKVLDGKFL
jgi:hypothetical protein